MMWGALIGAAGSLIGGAIQSKSAKNAANQERKWAVEDQAEQFVRLRAAAEKAGFNPLTALGAAPNSGMVNPTNAAQSYMGEAIATSSLMLADSMSKTAAAATGKKLQNANRANADLTRKLNAATLRPKMAGVFDRQSKFGTGAAAAKPGTSTAYGGTGPNGEIEPLYVYFRDPDGNLVPQINPNVSDGEQVAAGLAADAFAAERKDAYMRGAYDPKYGAMRNRNPSRGFQVRVGPVNRGGVSLDAYQRVTGNSIAGPTPLPDPYFYWNRSSSMMPSWAGSWAGQ